MIRTALRHILQGKDLTQVQARRVMQEIMDGEASESQIAALLVSLRMKGETVPEITGLAEGMLSRVRSVSWNGGSLLDTCGTGGDGRGTFNISTACAVVAAAAGVTVAKHGNRALSSRCGSADVLEELGLCLVPSSGVIRRMLEEVRLAFLFAPHFHPAMRRASGPRRELGCRTVFNILGPLTNPLRASIRVMGVYDAALTGVLARVMGRLGAERALVLWGEGGLDEATIAGRTKVAEWDGRQVREYWVDARELGFSGRALSALRGGDSHRNAGIIRTIMEGTDRGAPREAVVLNAAFCLLAAGRVSSLTQGMALAGETIDSGRAAQTLEAAVRLSWEQA